MMPYFELIYETGAYSIAEYADENEAVAAAKAQHARALAGEAGGPTGHAAERIVKVLMYNKHPNDFNPEGVVSNEEISNIELGSEGATNVNELTSELLNTINPYKPGNVPPHDSKFKMPEVKELTGWQEGSSG